MLDRLVDFLVSVVDLFFFAEIVNEWEEGVVLRFGRYHRSIGPGLHFYWPFHVERPICTSMAPEAHPFKEQKVTLCEGTTVFVEPIVTYRVSNARRSLLEVTEAEDGMRDVVAGVLRRLLARHQWAELVDADQCEAIEEAIAKGMRQEAFRWGIEILRVRFRSLVRVDSCHGILGGIGGQLA